MGFVVNFFFEFCGDGGVDGGGVKGAVAKQGLDGFEVHAVFEPVGGDGVADGVGRGSGGEARPEEIVSEAAVNRTNGEPFSPLV